MINFKKDYNSDYKLYKAVWGTWSKGFTQLQNTGKSVIENGINLTIPLSDNEIIDYLYSLYQAISYKLNNVKEYTELPENIKTKIGINSVETLQEQRAIYGKLADPEILKSLIHANYPNKFRVTVKNADQQEDLDGVDKDQADEAQQNEETRKIQNLQSEIAKDDEINPRTTLSDQVKLFLQTITDNKGNLVPKEFSMWTLFNTISSLPVATRNDFMMGLKNAFKSQVGLKGALHPDEIRQAVSAITRFGNIKTIDQSVLDEITNHFSTIQNYYSKLAASEKNPYIKYASQDAARTIGKIFNTLKNRASDDIIKTTNAVKDAIFKVKQITEETRVEDFKGNSYTHAIYSSIKQLAANAFQTDYFHEGSKQVRNFKPDSHFQSDNLFYQQGMYIKRVIGENTETFMRRIVTQVQNSFGKGTKEFDLEDVAAIWRNSKNYNLLAEIIIPINNSYISNPFRIKRKITEKDIKYTITTISDNKTHYHYTDVLFNNLNRLLIKQNSRGPNKFDKEVLVKTREAIGMNSYLDMSLRTHDATKKKIIAAFHQEILMCHLPYISTDLTAEAVAIHQLMSYIDMAIESKYRNPAPFSISNVLADAKGYLRDFTRGFVLADLQKSLAKYKNGDGKQVSYHRQKSSANDMLFAINRYTNATQLDNKRESNIFYERYPHLVQPIILKSGDETKTIIFNQLNPLNPFSPLNGTSIEVGVSRLFDAHIAGEEEQYVTTYSKESKKDILSRLIIGNFIAPLTQSNLFLRGGKFFTHQPFYVISDKDRSEGVDLETIPVDNESFNKHYGQLLFQMITRPLPSYKDGDATPFNVDSGNVYYSPFESVSSTDLKALRDRFEKPIQDALARDKRNGLYDSLDMFRKDAKVKQHLNNIQKEIIEEAHNLIKQISDNITENSTYVKDGEKITRRVKQATGMMLPSAAQMKIAYKTLVDRGILTLAQLEEFSKGKVTYENSVEMPGYESTLYNSAFDEEHLLPMMYALAANHFLRGYYLNQITSADDSALASSVKITKRMAIANGSGLSIYNMDNRLQEKGELAGKLKFAVVDDVIRYRNLASDITADNQNPDTHATIPADADEAFLKNVIKNLSGMSQLTTYQYKSLLQAYSKLGTNAEEVKDLIKQFEQTTLHKNQVNDGAGWITQRGHERLKQVVGPAMNMQDIMKPLVHGFDKYGVARNSKFAVEVLTDNIVSQFPNLLKLRMDADFGSLRTSNPVLYNRAMELEQKRMGLIKASTNRDNPKRLSATEAEELYKIYKNADNQPSHLIVPGSAVKYNAPKVKTGYDYKTQTYNPIDHTASTFAVDMRDFRIQQNPVANK